jgi:hypothetical protein
MTEQNELRIPFADLTCVSIKCESCSAEVSFDLTDYDKRREERLEIRASPDTRIRCSVCLKPFDSSMDKLLHFLAQAQGESAAKQRVFFRLPIGLREAK